jgi:hypothetical protein
MTAVYTLGIRLRALVALARRCNEARGYERVAVCEATVLLAAATLEAAASAFAHQIQPRLFNKRGPEPKAGERRTRPFRDAPAPRKVVMILGCRKLPHGTLALWAARSEIMHIGPQRARTFALINRCTPAGARRTVLTVLRVVALLEAHAVHTGASWEIDTSASELRRALG